MTTDLTEEELDRWERWGKLKWPHTHDKEFSKIIAAARQGIAAREPAHCDECGSLVYLTPSAPAGAMDGDPCPCNVTPASHCPVHDAPPADSLKERLREHWLSEQVCDEALARIEELEAELANKDEDQNEIVASVMRAEDTIATLEAENKRLSRLLAEAWDKYVERGAENKRLREALYGIVKVAWMEPKRQVYVMPKWNFDFAHAALMGGTDG